MNDPVWIEAYHSAFVREDTNIYKFTNMEETMVNLFDYNNKVFHFLSKVADSMILGILWLVCSIPVITVGAASSAFFYAYHKCIQQESGYVCKTFFHGFKTNFKQATVSWLLLLILTVIVILDCFILITMGGSYSISSVMLAIVILVLTVVTLMALFLFPYIARYENTLKDSMKNCLLILFSNLLWAVLLLLLLLTAVLIAVCIPVLSIFIPSVYMFFANKILEHVFQKYMQPDSI